MNKIRALRRWMRLRAGFPDEVAQVDLDDLGDLAAEPTAEPTAAPKTSPWEFDVFQIPAHDLEHVVLGFFDGLGLVRDRVHRATIGSLIAIVRRHYSTDNPYHNFQHCVDVAHATFLMLVGVRHAVSDLECYALLLAALAHDLEHPGVNNSYLIKSKHPLAITYNDISVLENRHAACFFELVARHPEADVFRDMVGSDSELVRKLIIHAIIHTDMCKHFPMVDRIREWSAIGPSTAAKDEEDRMLFVAAAILHAADISNPVRSDTASRAWADKIMEEFFRQGDLERASDLSLSPMCDRNETSLCSVQRGFIGSVVAPLYEAMGELDFLSPPEDEPGDNVFKVMHARAVEKLDSLYPPSL